MLGKLKLQVKSLFYLVDSDLIWQHYWQFISGNTQHTQRGWPWLPKNLQNGLNFYMVFNFFHFPHIVLGIDQQNLRDNTKRKLDCKHAVYRKLILFSRKIAKWQGMKNLFSFFSLLPISYWSRLTQLRNRTLYYKAHENSLDLPKTLYCCLQLLLWISIWARLVACIIS